MTSKCKMKGELRHSLFCYSFFRFFKIISLTLCILCAIIKVSYFKMGLCLTMTDEELVKRIFEDDGFVKLSGAEVVEITKEKAVVRADITAQHLNANGSVQGGMLYTLADFAFAILQNFLHPITVTQCGNITYVRAAVTKYITATAVETVRSGHNTVCEVTVRDDKEQIVCVCSFNGFVKDVPMSVLKEKYSISKEEN